MDSGVENMLDQPGRRCGFAFLFCFLSLSGCTVVGPDYTPPEPGLPDAYLADIPDPFEGTATPESWWQIFGDPALDRLIEAGRAANPSVQIAESRIREARAVARAVWGETGPRLDASAGAAATARVEGFAGDDAAGEDNRTDGQMGGVLDALWPLDLFGGSARTREAAAARARRQEALGREALRTTTAEIARTYVELRAAQRGLALAEDILSLQRQTLGVVEQRVGSGLAPALDQVRARGEVAARIAELGPLRSRIDGLGSALAILLDETPGALGDVLAGGNGIPRADTGPAVGVPRDLLRRRPDIQAAELAIVAANAEIGVAMADLYPAFTLPGSISLDLDDIGTGTTTALIASVGLALDVPIFDGGARNARLTAAEERAVQAGLTYRQTLLAALDEVERALFAYRGTRDRLAALEEAVANNRAAFEQSQVLYQRGFATFIDVLDSQRTLNTSLRDQAIAQRDLALQVIALYTALGGKSAGSVPE